MTASAAPTLHTQRPQSPWARPLFGVNAAVAWCGVLLQFALTALGTYPSQNTVSSILGNNDQGALGRIFDYFTYFTILSNILVAVVMTMLLINPRRDGRVFRVLRLDTILMITVTGIVYNLVLAGDANPQGWGAVANSIEHQITPVLTVLVWLFVGPRGWITPKVMALSFVLPILWLIYALIRGAIIGAYPYPFLDVVTNGYGTVLVNVVGIIVFALVLNAIFWALDRVLSRSRSRA